MDEHDLQSPKLATGSLWELFVRVAGPASSVSVLTSEQGYSPLIVDCGGLFCYNFGTTAVSLIADDTLKCLFSICVRKVGGEGEGRRETGGKSYSSGICVLMSRGNQNPPPPPVWPTQGSSGLSGCYKWTQEDILKQTPDNSVVYVQCQRNTRKGSSTLKMNCVCMLWGCLCCIRKNTVGFKWHSFSISSSCTYRVLSHH